MKWWSGGVMEWVARFPLNEKPRRKWPEARDGSVRAETAPIDERNVA